MSIVIEQTFPLGRFHATRWNQNSFEDRLGEWPPSPWRLLRALAARWFQHQRETGDDGTNLRDQLLRALAGELPAFRLPIETWPGRELRQYQPTALDLQFKYRKNSTANKNELDYSFREVSRTLSLDRYRAISPTSPVYWIWHTCVLSPEATELLRQLLGRMHYFGRAETWTRMRLVEAEGIEPNCDLRPIASSDSVPVLAYRSHLAVDVDLLLASTDDNRLSSRRIPPGTAWFYAELPPRAEHSILLYAKTRASPVHLVRYTLDSTVLPLVTETLPVAEAARRAVMGMYGRLTERNGVRGRSDVLSGKDEHGQILAGHRHAYYLPTDEDGDCRLDHLTVYATDGFGHDEQLAFDRLHELRTGRDTELSHPLRALLLNMSTLDEPRPGPLGESKVWLSATPYIATHYAKTRGAHRIDLSSPEARATFLEEDLRRQLAVVRHDLATEGVKVEPLWDESQVFSIASRWRPIQFKRYRRKATDDGGRRLAGAFRLTFPHPVPGPLALGWSSHFGLGLFLPSDTDAKGV